MFLKKIEIKQTKEQREGHILKSTELGSEVIMHIAHKSERPPEKLGKLQYLILERTQNSQANKLKFYFTNATP